MSDTMLCIRGGEVRAMAVVGDDDIYREAIAEWIADPATEAILKVDVETARTAFLRPAADLIMAKLVRAVEAVGQRTPPPPSSHVAGRWLPIAQADKTINHVTEFTQIGLTLKNSDTFWVRDEDGRIYRAAWSEGNNGRDYWWDWEAESPVDPVEFMPHPLDPRWSASTEGSTDG